MQMDTFKRTFPRLAEIRDASLGRDIGRTCRYNVPAEPTMRAKYLQRNGTVVVDTVWLIIGVQLDHADRQCYRVVCSAAPFGRCAHPSEVTLDTP